MHATISRTVLTVDGLRAPLLEARGRRGHRRGGRLCPRQPLALGDWVPLLERAGQLARAVAWDHPSSARPPSRPASTPPSTATLPT